MYILVHLKRPVNDQREGKTLKACECTLTAGLLASVCLCRVSDEIIDAAWGMDLLLRMHFFARLGRY